MRATLWLAGPGDERLAEATIAALGARRPADRTYAEPAALLRDLDASAQTRARVATFCAKHDLEIVGSGFRSVVTAGTIADYERAFATSLSDFTDDTAATFHRRTAALAVPDALAPLVRGVFGLDAWPPKHATPETLPAPSASSNAAAHDAAARATDEALPERVRRSELAAQTWRRYNVPERWTGRGQTIGILRYGGTFDRDDLTAALAAHGVRAEMPAIVACDDASAIGSHVASFEGELALDVQTVATLAPGARVVLYTTPHGERGFLDALAYALFDAPTPAAFSISFGYPEYRWTHAALERLDELAAVAALLGVTLLAASGDGGADVDERGDAHVCAPAANRYVLACGGTIVDPADARVERAWPHAGGGFAARTRVPAWQRDAVRAYLTARAATAAELEHATRGVPDVAGQVDPGFRMVYRGNAAYTRGTSAIAPMWAALVARLNERLGVRAGFFAPLLYANVSGTSRDASANAPLRAIVDGGNDRYPAGTGWSPVTGLGVPDGMALYERLSDP